MLSEGNVRICEVIYTHIFILRNFLISLDFCSTWNVRFLHVVCLSFSSCTFVPTEIFPNAAYISKRTCSISSINSALLSLCVSLQKCSAYGNTSHSWRQSGKNLDMEPTQWSILEEQKMNLDMYWNRNICILCCIPFHSINQWNSISYTDINRWSVWGVIEKQFPFIYFSFKKSEILPDILSGLQERFP